MTYLFVQVAQSAVGPMEFINVIFKTFLFLFVMGMTHFLYKVAMSLVVPMESIKAIKNYDTTNRPKLINCYMCIVSQVLFHHLHIYVYTYPCTHTRYIITYCSFFYLITYLSNCEKGFPGGKDFTYTSGCKPDFGNRVCF